jgi:creatinine amidohydrolase/Fe(II)-dependent formamide hydrolase-like protein
MSVRRWAELTTEEAAAIGPGATLVQPLGAIEQHGPHLPLITDALIAETLSARAVAGSADVFLLPPLHYGKSTEHLGRAGTVALSTNTLLAVLADLGASLAAGGVRRLVLVNGHGGQPGLLDVAARDIRDRSGLRVFSITPMRFGMPEGFVNPDPFDIHGGFAETSLMLHLAPELVRADLAEPGGLEVGARYGGLRRLTLEGPVWTAWLTDDLTVNGIVGDPRAATAEAGAAIAAHWTAALAEALGEIRGFEFPLREGGS